MKYFNFLFTSIIFKKLLRLTCFFFPGEPRRVFHHLSWVFLNFLSWVFHCLSWVVPRFLGITFTLIGVFADFLSHTLFLCCCSASATALRELLLPSSVFLPYTPSSHLSQYHECYRTERVSPQVLFTLHSFQAFATFGASTGNTYQEQRDTHWMQALPLHIKHNDILHQPAFKGLLRAGGSSLKLQGLPTMVQNTDPAHLFVWITQCSEKGIARWVIFMCWD